jgi:hypothetical protein
MTYFGLKHIALGGRLLAFPGYEITDGKGGKVLSEPVDIDSWFSLPPDFRDLIIAVDEIQNFFNSLKHMTVLNYLFSALMAQRRHRNLGLFYTVQEWGWLDNRIRWLTHILVTCNDLYHTPWGKEEGIKRGELTSATFWDCKGFITGHPWECIGQYMLRGTELHGCFDSYCDVDMFAGMTKVVIKKPQTTIDLRAQDEGEIHDATPPGDVHANDNALLAELSPGLNPMQASRLMRRLRKD